MQHVLYIVQIAFLSRLHGHFARTEAVRISVENVPEIPGVVLDD